MGRISLEEVIQILDEGGIRADSAYPPQQISRVTEPVAAVSLAQADQQDNTVTVLVEILGPKEKGAAVCQKKALDACDILANAGAVCQQGSCGFLAKGNLFRVPVRAVFPLHEKFTVIAGQWLLSYFCGFSSEQAKTEDTALENAPWKITVEELFPWGVQDTLTQEEPFDLEIHCNGYVERYADCKWERCQRTVEKAGIRQIRSGTAVRRMQTIEQ